jgi:hypothetical protein
LVITHNTYSSATAGSRAAYFNGGSVTGSTMACGRQSSVRRVCIVRLDNDEVGKCEKCNRRPLEIDHYGQRLIGCIDCNRWSWEGSKHLFMELVEEDLLALRDGLIRR